MSGARQAATAEAERRHQLVMGGYARAVREDEALWALLGVIEADAVGRMVYQDVPAEREASRMLVLTIRLLRAQIEDLIHVAEDARAAETAARRFE